MPEAPLGIFGGTFDPVHLGHLRLAEEAILHLGLTGVRWLPAGAPALRERPRVSARQRLEMVRLATAENPLFSLDDSEVNFAEKHPETPSYTIDTLRRLRHELGPRQPLVLLVGADAFAGFPGWKDWRALFSLAHVGVSHRPGFPVTVDSLPAELAAEFSRRRLADPEQLAGAPAGGIVSFAMTQLDISATQIRKLLANGSTTRYLLADAVVDYIALHHLYTSL